MLFSEIYDLPVIEMECLNVTIGAEKNQNPFAYSILQPHKEQMGDQR
jgi:hypothetical protein